MYAKRTVAGDPFNTTHKCVDTSRGAFFPDGLKCRQPQRADDLAIGHSLVNVATATVERHRCGITGSDFDHKVAGIIIWLELTTD
ncbi:hypothetical protein D3C80_1730170 [compost metagenome]